VRVEMSPVLVAAQVLGAAHTVVVLGCARRIEWVRLARPCALSVTCLSWALAMPLSGLSCVLAAPYMLAAQQWSQRYYRPSTLVEVTSERAEVELR